MVQVPLVGSFSALFPSSPCDLEGTREDLVPGTLPPGCSHRGSPIKLGSWGSRWALPPPPRPSPRSTKRERGWTTSSRVRAAPDPSRASLAPRHNPVWGWGAAHPPPQTPRRGWRRWDRPGERSPSARPRAPSAGEGAGCRGERRGRGERRAKRGGAEPRPPAPQPRRRCWPSSRRWRPSVRSRGRVASKPRRTRHR